MTLQAQARVGSRAAAVLGLVLALLVIAPAQAEAHAVLETSVPPWGAVLRVAPQAIKLTYDEGVVPRYVHITVVTARGQSLARRPRVKGAVIVVPLRAGPVGSYTVRWRVVASDDGHVTQGAFGFGVRAKPLPPAPASGLSVPLAPQLLTWLQFLGVVLAGGTLTFRAVVLAPAARKLRAGGEREARLALWAGAIGAVVALHAGLLGFLVGAYPIVGGGLLNVVNTQIIPIRVGTHLGQAWTLTTFAWLAVLALVVAAWVTPRRRDGLLASAGALSLATAFGLSWAGHPASRGTVALLADYAHLVAAALWAGGVIALLALALSVGSLPRSARQELLRECLLRFSRLAVPAVVVLALAGAYIAIRELPAPSAVLGTGYGVTLLLKACTFLAAVGLGGYHRAVVIPRVKAGRRAITIRRTLTVEAGLLLAALALAAVLSQTAPPR